MLNKIGLSHNGNTLILCWVGSNGIKIYDYNTMAIKAEININSINLSGYQFTPDDNYLVTASGVLKMWDVNSGKLVASKAGGCETLDISKDNKYLATSIEELLILKQMNISSVENNTELSKQIFPNPSTGEFTLTYKTISAEPTKIEVADINGNIIKLLMNEVIPAGEHTQSFNTSGLAEGVYLIKIQNGKNSFVYKLIINK